MSKMITTLQCKKIVKKTKAEMFQNIQPNDLITFSLDLTQSHWSINGTKALYITATNIRTKEKTERSIAQISNALENFVFQPIDNQTILCNPGDTVYYPDKNMNCTFDVIVEKITKTIETSIEPDECNTQLIYTGRIYDAYGDEIKTIDFTNKDFDDHVIFTDRNIAQMYLTS